MPTDQQEQDAPTAMAQAAESARNALVPSTVEGWGAKKPTEDGFVTELPSGEIVKMRRTLDLPVLLATGRIPNPLANIVQQMMQQGTTAFPAEMQDMNAVKQLMELLDSTVVACILEPPFSKPDARGDDESEEEWTARLTEWKPDEGTVSIYAMDVQDKMYVFAVAQGGAADLARFREEQAAALGDVQAGEGVPSAAKRAVGNRQQRRAAAKPRKKS